MALSAVEIQSMTSDQELMEKLLGELNRCLPPGSLDGHDEFVAAIVKLPPGLRAMAASYKLDLSIALDDLGWHFGNFHHREYCDETSRALWELEATDVAVIFDRAYSLVIPHWDTISNLLAKGFGEFRDWYLNSELEAALMPLNHKLWVIYEAQPPFGFMNFWLYYARKYPERLVQLDG
jgi:hypothetical protein